ncbi:SDR family NAD(P)-dependent oxidoreductase [Sphingomonas sp. HF-S3]|uniref:SDR family NAD(P)-dependent oxidoreductase n=1 Tax=Sphingomonas rustica TaxID=3103142 RepID=A0ABV0BDH3_9SPHN
MPSFIERLLFPAPRLDLAALGRRLEGRTVLVTGASFGIGEQVARIAGRAGARVLLVARTASRLEEVAADIAADGGIAQGLPCDFSDGAAVERLAAALPAVDIFVSNAGKSIRRPILASLGRPQDVTRTGAINYLAPCRLALAAMPGLVARKGQIINVSAANVLLPPAPGWAAYQASKTAFDQWLRSAAPELRAVGVAVSSIYLPLVRTRMIAPTRSYDRVPAMSPEHAAHHVAAAILTRSRRWRPWWLPPVQLAAALAGSAWEPLAEHRAQSAVR